MISLHVFRRFRPILFIISLMVVQGLAFAEYPRLIYQAVERWDVPVARALIEADGTLLTQINMFGSIPLHNAASNGDIEMAKLLLDAGADVNAVNLGGFSPLHCAIHEGHIKMIELLLSRGAALTVEGRLERFEVTAQRGNDPRIVDLLQNEWLRRVQENIVVEPLRPRDWGYNDRYVKLSFMFGLVI